MITSAELQRQAFYRKLVYFGLIIALFTLATFSGTFLRAMLGDRGRGWTVGERAENLQMSESNQGQANVLGSTASVAMTGSRGFAICLLWMGAIEKQKRHEWNELEQLVNVITKLQPHFLTPWLFQSWNLSYNVAVESDRVSDKYFYIGKGIQLLAEGERVNRVRCTDRGPDRLERFEVGHPDMRYWVGFYYMNKFGTSDEQNALRSMFQISCINPKNRDPQKLRPDGRNVDPVEFEKFVKENPYLCRRLRDYLRCYRPDEIVNFLQDNAKNPSRYVEEDGVWKLNRNVDDQFPVFPRWSGGEYPFAPTLLDVGGEFENYHAALAWNLFAQEPTPPFIKREPEDEPPAFDLRYRKPRSPALIIFRGQPSRCRSYIAERLQREGWFDEKGWVVDKGYTDSLWFKNTVVAAENDLRYSSLEGWKKAYADWKQMGDDHGLLLDQTEIDRRDELAQKYRATYSVVRYNRGQNINREQVGEEMWKSYQAHRSISVYIVNKQMTNFDFFLYKAEAEADPKMVEVRRLLYEAERMRRSGNQDEAVSRFREAFDRLCGVGYPALLERYPHFRDESTTQEDFYEKYVKYMQLLESTGGVRMRTAMSAAGLFSFGMSFDPISFAAPLVYFDNPKSRELPMPFIGPLDGVDSAGKSWIYDHIKNQVKVSAGIIRPPAPQGPPPGARPPGGGTAVDTLR